MFTALIIILICLAGFLLFVSIQPNRFHVERSTQIAAPPEVIFPLINDLHAWERWTPYDRDPDIRRTYHGAASGRGAVYEWDGNKQVGKGSVTIVASDPARRVGIDLNMLKPFAARNKVEFTLRPDNGVTTVTWGMDGKMVFISKLVGLFMNMDTMVGKDFEVGLAKLKALAEEAKRPS